MPCALFSVVWRLYSRCDTHGAVMLQSEACCLCIVYVMDVNQLDLTCLCIAAGWRCIQCTSNLMLALATIYVCSQAVVCILPDHALWMMMQQE